MEQRKLDRISELTDIARRRELTQEESEERRLLREEYLAEWRASTKAALDSVVIVDERGTKRRLTDKRGGF